MGDERHDITVALTSWAKRADVAVITERTAEAADDKAGVGTAADRVLRADIHAERLVWGGFAQPRFEVVEQVRDLLDFVRTRKLWLAKKVT